MAIFHCYVSSQEGISKDRTCIYKEICLKMGSHPTKNNDQRLDSWHVKLSENHMTIGHWYRLTAFCFLVFSWHFSSLFQEWRSQDIDQRTRPQRAYSPLVVPSQWWSSWPATNIQCQTKGEKRLRLYLKMHDISPTVKCKAYLSGWWYTYPSEKYMSESQWEGWHPIYEMENKQCLKPPMTNQEKHI